MTDSERSVVLSVVAQMDQHILGVEGMEDSPVAGWAASLRVIVDDSKRDSWKKVMSDSRLLGAVTYCRVHPEVREMYPDCTVQERKLYHLLYRAAVLSGCDPDAF